MGLAGCLGTTNSEGFEGSDGFGFGGDLGFTATGGGETGLGFGGGAENIAPGFINGSKNGCLDILKFFRTSLTKIRA